MSRPKWKYKNGKIYHGTKVIDFDKVCEVINFLEGYTNCMLIEGRNNIWQLTNTLHRISRERFTDQRDGLKSIHTTAYNGYLVGKWVGDIWLRADVNKLEEEILGEKNNDNKMTAIEHFIIEEIEQLDKWFEEYDATDIYDLIKKVISRNKKIDILEEEQKYLEGLKNDTKRISRQNQGQVRS